jgi:hypothetical protein
MFHGEHPCRLRPNAADLEVMSSEGQTSRWGQRGAFPLLLVIGYFFKAKERSFSAKVPLTTGY